MAEERRRQQPAGARLRLTADERAALDALNGELPPDLWERYRLLSTRVRKGEERARAELLQRIQKIEEWNVRRVTLLEGMARRRGTHFPELIKANDIRHHPDAERA